jgi:hypothetical protein
MEQDMEYFARQMVSTFSNKVLAVYRALARHFEQFICKLEFIVNYIHNPKAEFITCGEINIYFCNETYCKQCMIPLLTL